MSSMNEVDVLDDVMQENDVTATELSRASELANLIKISQQRVAELEKMLEAEQDHLKRLEEVELPSFMEEVGLSSFSLPTGEKITIKNIVKASIPKAKREEACQWLTENGFGDLIKSELVLLFGKEELQKAQDLKNQLQSMGLKPVLEQGVHHTTLSAFVKEQLEQGVFMPADLLGIYTGKKALLK